MLKRIRIKGYKSLKDLEASLKPLSVLFGPTGAGKSNFLDALQLLSGMATGRTLQEAFLLPCRGKALESFSFGENGLEDLLNRKTASFSIEADIELSKTVVDSVNRHIREMRKGGPAENDIAAAEGSRSFVRSKNLRYRIELEILPESGLLRVADEYLAALSRKGEIIRSREPFLEKVGSRLHLRMDGQAHPTYHDLYLDHSVLSMPLYPPHYPHFTALRREMAGWQFFCFEPREGMRSTRTEGKERRIGFRGNGLFSCLNALRVLDEPQFKSLEKELRSIMPDVKGVDVGVNSLGEMEFKLREGKIPIPSGLLSEGALRILGLLALSYSGEPPSLIGIEEPENGLDPRRIRMIADLLKDRAEAGYAQFIVATHSPVLLERLSDEQLFSCRKEEGQTMIEPFKAWGSLGRKDAIDETLEADA